MFFDAKVKHHLEEGKSRPGPRAITHDLGRHLEDLLEHRTPKPGFTEVVIDDSGRFEITPYELEAGESLFEVHGLSDFEQRYGKRVFDKLRIVLPEPRRGTIYVVDRRSSSRQSTTLGFSVVELMIEGNITKERLQQGYFTMWYVTWKDQEYVVETS